MTLQVAVLGVDGSGKSTLAAALPAVLAADFGLRAGAAVGDEFWVRAPAEDVCGPGYHPYGYPFAARLDALARWAAKRSAGGSRLYPVLKVLQMLLQDNAAVKLSLRYQVDVMVSDGNLLLSGAGRAFNYRPGAETVSDSDVAAGFAHLLRREPLAPAVASRLPSLGAARMLARLARVFRWRGIWLPDRVIFLDIPPETALQRIHARGGGIDAHETLPAMRTARQGYRRALAAYREERGDAAVITLDPSRMTPGDVLRAAVEHLQVGGAIAPRAAGRPLHESSRGLLRAILSYRYLVRYLGGKFFAGAWRELLFPLSHAGRFFLRRGYSAGVMRLIYESDEKPQPPAARVFFDYPLHRAVYDRLQVLTHEVEHELRRRLEHGAPVRIFTAPSGFSYDLFRPLEQIAASDPGAVARVHVVAADLDPDGLLAPELTERAARLRLGGFRFLLGDLTRPEMQAEVTAAGPYDLLMFVGLSAWLPKPALLAHLRMLRGTAAPGALLVTDAFTPAAYALGGHYVGYHASYYPPATYTALLDYCGFQATTGRVRSGRDGINHAVFLHLPASEREDGVKGSRDRSRAPAPPSRRARARR